MLEETVRELKGEEVAPEIHSALNLGLDIRIPPTTSPTKTSACAPTARSPTPPTPRRASAPKRNWRIATARCPRLRNLLEYSGAEDHGGEDRHRSHRPAP
jgi:hypothetical protein